MKNLNNYIIILSLLSIAHISAKTSSIGSSQYNLNLANNALFSPQTPTSVFNQPTDQILGHLYAVHGILSDLSAIISDNQINGITKKRKRKILSNIKSLMREIEEKKNILIAGRTDSETINFVLHFSSTVINHINKALNAELKDFPAFDSQSLQVKSTKHATPATIHRSMIANQKKLIQLKKAADIAGLRWYNRAYRKFDRFILQPGSKYGLIAGSGFLAGGLIYWLARKDENIKGGLIGPTPKMNSGFGMYEDRTNEGDLGWYGWADHTTAKIKNNLLPITGFLLASTFNKYHEEWKLNWQPWLSKKLQSTHYRLMGGAYTVKADKLDNIRAEVTFDDLVGLGHVKNYFKLLVDYLENPESFDRQKLTPQKGCLLVGPTRTGKSFSVAALHGEVKRMLKRNKRDAKFEFIELPAALINREGISILLQIIKYHAPCVVFIDEIDLLNLQRTGKNETLSEFLTSMSGALESTDPKKQVIIIAATNRPENLDIALRQPGRFGKELRFEYPSFKERKDFLKHKLKKLSLNMNSFNIDKLARETDGKSYEGLKALIDHSVLKARLNGQMISQEHLEETLDQEVRRVLLEDIKEVPEHEKRLLAAHFAGHALALTLLDAHTQLAKVTIKPVMTKIKEELIGKQLWQGAFGKKQSKDQERYEYGNIFTYCTQDSVNMLSHDEKIKLIKAHLAGNIAEKLLLGSCSYSCHTEDKEKALEIAISITFEGMDPEHLPRHVKKQRYDKALALLDQCEKEMTQLMEQHKDALENIVQELEDFGTLSAEEVKEVIDDTENQ